MYELRIEREANEANFPVGGFVVFSWLQLRDSLILWLLLRTSNQRSFLIRKLIKDFQIRNGKAFSVPTMRKVWDGTFFELLETIFSNCK